MPNCRKLCQDVFKNSMKWRITKVLLIYRWQLDNQTVWVKRNKLSLPHQLKQQVQGTHPLLLQHTWCSCWTRRCVCFQGGPGHLTDTSNATGSRVLTREGGLTDGCPQQHRPWIQLRNSSTSQPRLDDNTYATPNHAAERLTDYFYGIYVIINTRS